MRTPPQNLKSFAEPFRVRLAVASGLAVLQAGLILLGPWPLKIAVDQAASHQAPPSWLGFLNGMSSATLAGLAAVASVALVVVSGAVDYAETMIVAVVSERIGARMRRTLMRHLFELSGRFYDQHRSGDLVTRVMTDVGRVQDALVASYTILVPQSLTLVGMVFVLLRLDLTLGLIGLTAVPPLVFVVIRRRRLVKVAQREARESSGALATSTSDLVRNVKVVQAFQRQALMMERFGAHNREATRTSIVSTRIDARFSPLSDLVLAVGTALVLWIGVVRVTQARMSVGTLLVVLTYVGSVYGPVRSLSRLSTSLARGAASKERLNEVMLSEARISNGGTGNRVYPMMLGLSFRNVSFGYDPDSPVLHDISFEVQARENFCIVGPSGSGKSTILQLMLRLYDPTAGEIRFDGENIKDLDVVSLRDRFGFVLQQPWMIDGTVADNLAFGRPDVTLDEIKIIGRLALIDEFIERLPQGYDTPVGEGGAQLSGGQLRRISLARALVRLPDVLLLDEPTTGLDAHSEAKVMATIEQVRRGRTIITVTHRLALSEQADRVAVIERGRIVEIGAPAELRALGGHYARLLGAANTGSQEYQRR